MSSDSSDRGLKDNDTSVTTFYPDRPSTDSSRWIFVAPQSSNHSLPAGSGPFVADIELYAAVPPDSGYGWVVVVGTIILNFIVDGILHSHGKLRESMEESLNCDSVQVAALWSVQLASYYFMFPVTSALINGYGVRRIGVIGSLVCAVGFTAASFVNRFVLVLLFYSIFGGIGLGVVYACAAVIVNFYFERHRAMATTLGACGSGLGIAAVPALIHLQLEKPTLHWHDATIYYAGACFGMAFVCLLLKSVKPVQVTLPAERKVTFEFGSSQRIPERGEQWPYKYPSLRDMLSNPRISLLEFHRTYKFANRLLSDTRFDRTEEEVKHLVVRARPMYRHDIFFCTAMKKLSEYTDFMIKTGHRSLNQARTDNLKYHLYVSRVISIDTKLSIETMSAPVWRVLELLFDPDLLKVQTFRLLALINVLIGLGYCTPIYHLHDYTIKQTSLDENILMVLFGCSFAAGHVFVSFLNCNRPHLNASAVCGLQITIAGGMTMLTAYPHRKTLGQFDQYLFVMIYGFAMASVINLRSMVLVTHVGLESLTNAFGLVKVFLGLGVLLGAPLGAYLCTSVERFEPAFLFSGGCHITAGMVSFIILKCDLNLGIC